MRTTFLVDGFNLYHSIVDASKLLGRQVKWLDLHGFCASWLHNIDPASRVHEIHYFSALATHKELSNPGVVKRHRIYIAGLKATGVIVHLNSFKKRIVRCKRCGNSFTRHEEKETDVMIACKFLEIMYEGLADCVVLVSGDTDLRPAIAQGRMKSPKILTAVVLPYQRANRDLGNAFHFQFKARPNSYATHQFPDPFVDTAGREIVKPDKW